eukprot:scaffold332816_cov44-Attheya_sp.AAC.2
MRGILRFSSLMHFASFASLRWLILPQTACLATYSNSHGDRRFLRKQKKKTSNQGGLAPYTKQGKDTSPLWKTFEEAAKDSPTNTKAPTTSPSPTRTPLKVLPPKNSKRRRKRRRGRGGPLDVDSPLPTDSPTTRDRPTNSPTDLPTLTPTREPANALIT